MKVLVSVAKWTLGLCEVAVLLKRINLWMRISSSPEGTVYVKIDCFLVFPDAVPESK